ncbi:hypothetical protein [Subtercola sp. RTI3]|uniref:hypothetical protein n=1 Tax=Subtercola sp. RTI3 TaxID=3048639 RepID=UPI002B2256A6|nr:hypothetical protein [Subtercola sp. RTI3]MEA9985986.1 hypothetical protein [Subtercola sp. RTI3]
MTTAVPGRRWNAKSSVIASLLVVALIATVTVGVVAETAQVHATHSAAEADRAAASADLTAMQLRRDGQVARLSAAVQDARALDTALNTLSTAPSAALDATATSSAAAAQVALLTSQRQSIALSAFDPQPAPDRSAIVLVSSLATPPSPTTAELTAAAALSRAHEANLSQLEEHDAPLVIALEAQAGAARATLAAVAASASASSAQTLAAASLADDPAKLTLTSAAATLSALGSAGAVGSPDALATAVTAYFNATVAVRKSDTDARAAEAAAAAAAAATAAANRRTSSPSNSSSGSGGSTGISGTIVHFTLPDPVFPAPTNLATVPYSPAMGPGVCPGANNIAIPC